MTSIANQEMRIISAEDAVAEYGFKVGRNIVITGLELTSEKVALLMKEAIRVMNLKTKNPTEALFAFNKFREFCKAQQAELTFKS